MRNRLFVGGLLVILIALMAVAAIQSLPRPDLESTAAISNDLRDAQLVFGTFTTEDMQALRIDDPLSEIDLILERGDEGEWRLVGAPNNGYVDAVVADNIAKTVAFLPYTELVAGIFPEDYINYGLSAESVWLQIQVILKAGESYNIVLGGQVASADSGYYALVDDRETLYILDRGAVDYLNVYLRQIQIAFA